MLDLTAADHPAGLSLDCGGKNESTTIDLTNPSTESDQVQFRNSMGQAARITQPDVAAWTPAILTEYEIGRAVLAAEVIARSEKAVAEVGCQKVASTAALKDDLHECVKLAGHADNVHVWTLATNGGRVRYGFYREEWVLAALDFLERADLSDIDRAWISGLLYGYRGDAIQQFLRRMVGAATT